MSRKIQIVDTTSRDGEQSLQPHAKAELAEQLERPVRRDLVGVDTGVRAAGLAASSGVAFARACAQPGLQLAGGELNAAFRRFKELADSRRSATLEELFEGVIA